MIHNFSGKSLKELKEEFGTDSKGFYDQNWYEKEAFWNEKPEAGVYEINIEKALTNLTYEEQKERLNGFEFPHPAVLAEAILTHYKNTGERFLEDWYSRTGSITSGGHRVHVGLFGSRGLVVGYWGDGRRGSNVGLASSRKFKEDSRIESLNPFENNEFLIVNGVKYNKACDKCGR